jgi:myo-inositol-1(or 4)-monophosphatase
MENTLISTLKASGEVLLKSFNKPVEAKIKESQSSIVTKADLKSDSLIVNMIRERFPAHNIISEESGYTNNNSNYTWIIDPLDGTSNFASALPWFGVLIAIFDGNIPVMGGAYLPTNNVLYFAEKGKGAFKNGKRFSMIKNKHLIKSLISFSVDYTDDEIFLNKCIGIYKNIVRGARNIRSTNSLVDFIYVAEGKFGGCINLFTRVWDISALGLIISEAGGTMVDINGEKIEFILDKNIVNKNYSVIAGSEEIVSSLMKIII